tara:strand:- start:91 stop:501 length:411 start_codon:yes stop_codon:yes gene_type:complete
LGNNLGIYDNIYRKKYYGNLKMVGIIYKLYSPDCEKIYIGSTSRENLNIRFHEHKGQSKPTNRRNSTSQYLFRNYDKVFIEPLETFEDIDKKDLAIIETKYILKNNCLNERIPVKKSILKRIMKEENIQLKEDNIP